EYFIESSQISFKRIGGIASFFSSKKTKSTRSNLQYVQIEHQIRQTPNWPLINDKVEEPIAVRGGDNERNSNYHDNNSTIVDNFDGNTNHQNTTISIIGNIQQSSSTGDNDVCSTNF
ncbi:unnamed protein product, partial [Didymodactylos carnosus]